MKVVQTLEDTNELQDAILEAQRKSLFQQERLLESSSQLGIALDMSKDNVKDMLEEFRYIYTISVWSMTLNKNMFGLNQQVIYQ